MDLDIIAPATWIVLGAIALVALIWHWAEPAHEKNFPAAGKRIVLAGFWVLLVFAIVAMFSVVNCTAST